MDGKSFRLVRAECDGHRATPRIISFLYDLDIGTGNLTDIHAAADEQIDVQGLRSLGVTPCRNHQQRARNIADAARANVPWRSQRIDQRVGVAEILAFEIHRAHQGVIHRLLIKICIASIVVGQVELVLEEDESAAGAGLAVRFVAQGVVRAKSL